MPFLTFLSGPAGLPDRRVVERLVPLLDLVFHADGTRAPEAIRQFLLRTPKATDLLAALPAGPHSRGELLQAVAAALVRESVVNDSLIDRLVDHAPGARKTLESARVELLHPERRPPEWVAIGPEGGSIERIAVDPHDPSRLMCCSHLRFRQQSHGHRGTSRDRDRLGLYRSLDRGASWSAVPEPGPSGRLVRWIEFDPHRPGRILIATQDGLWETSEYGERWQRILSDDNSRWDDRVTWQVRLHPHHEGARLVTTGQDLRGGGVTAGSSIGASGTSTSIRHPEVRAEPGRKEGWFQFLDPDEGTWHSSNLGRPRTAAAFDPRDWRRLWIAERRGIVRSVDGGRTFALLRAPSERNVWDIAVDPHDSARLVVASDDGIFLSTDGGLEFDCVDSTGTARQIAVSEYSAHMYAATGRGPLISSDHGATWQVLGTGFPRNRCWSLALSSNGTVYAGADGSGVFRLDAGSDAWIARSEGLLPIPVMKVAQSTSGRLVAPSSVATFATVGHPASWEVIGPKSLAVALADHEQIAAGGSGTVRLTRDGGTSWQDAEPLNGDVFWVHVQDGGVWSRTSPGGVLRRLKEDLSWQECGPASESEPIRLIDVLASARGPWLAIAVDGRLFMRDAQSGDWRAVTPGPETSGWQGTWRLSGRASGELWAWRYEGGLCYCSALGREWQTVELPPVVEAVGGVCLDPRGRSGALVAAEDGSLFHLFSPNGPWHRLAKAWETGRCGFLEAVRDPPSVLGMGTSGLYRCLLA